jgi:hypothetical protein
MKNYLASRFSKLDAIKRVNESPDKFRETVEIALSHEETISWRAAWVLYHAMEDNDPRLEQFTGDFMNKLPGLGDGHQREILRIIGRLPIPEDQEGQLFDHCMNIWEQIGKIPSVRVFAFRIILKIASRYPEMKQEIQFITQPHYTDTLSPGIRNSVERMIQSVNSGKRIDDL